MEGEARNLLLVLVQDLKTAVVEGQAAPVTHHIFILGEVMKGQDLLKDCKMSITLLKYHSIVMT